MRFNELKIKFYGTVDVTLGTFMPAWLFRKKDILLVSKMLIMLKVRFLFFSAQDIFHETLSYWQ